MTPAARAQGAIDLLDAILAAAKGGGASADRVASEWFKARRGMDATGFVPITILYACGLVAMMERIIETRSLPLTSALPNSRRQCMKIF